LEVRQVPYSQFCWTCMTRHRKDRGLRTERVVATYLSQWWRSACVGRGAGKDILNVPFDVEIKARTAFQPLEWLRQATKRASASNELPFVVCRMNGQGEDASEYLAFMRFGDLVQLLLPMYGDIQKDSVELEPERCTSCGSWKLKDVPCRTCQVSNANL
jgi:hypothetical protein